MKDYISEEELDEIFEDAKKTRKYYAEKESFEFVRQRIKWLLEQLSYRKEYKYVSYIILNFNNNEKKDFHEYNPGNDDPMHEGWMILHCLKLQDDEVNAYFNHLLNKYFDIDKKNDSEWRITLKQ